MINTLELSEQDVVSVLFPTCPLRTADDIRGAYATFLAGGGQTPVVAVAEYDYPIQVALKLEEGGRLSPVFEQEYRKSTRHNDHVGCYRANYAVIFNTAGNFRRQSNLIGQHPVSYVMPIERSIDIDTPFQFALAKLLIESGALR
jgi:CMP-N-acetylneuraminic acid synthetase